MLMEERKMSGAHEPREEFVNQLELQLRADLRRRNLAAGAHTWMPQSRIAVALAIAAVAIASMALGGGVVAAAYEARLSEQRDVLLETVEGRAAIAKQRLALATQQLRNVQQRVAVGIEPTESVPDAQFKVNEAEAELKSIELDIAEIRATGREPVGALSAPLVSGRDFVTERWRVEMSVPAAALELEKVRAQAARGRFDVGLANAMEVEAAGTRLIELESAVEVFRRKIEIRQTFLKGGLAAAAADLRGLEAETDLRRTALGRRIDFARRQVRDLKARIDVGTANPLNLAEAELRLQELQLEMTRADYDLLLIRKQLGK
jgi:outer membrane protein TolC